MSDTSSTARPSVVLATLAAIAIVLAVCATAATVLVATDATRQHAAASMASMASMASASETPGGVGAATPGATPTAATSATERAAAFAAARNAFNVARADFHRVTELGPLIDSLVAALGPPAVADAGQIAIMARLRVYPLSAVERESDIAHPVWVALPDSLVMPDALSVDRARLTRVLDQLSRERSQDRSQELSKELSPSPRATSDIALAAADTLSSWMTRWRTHARSAPYPPMWGYRAGLPGVESAFDLPARNGQSLFVLAQLNVLTGWIALGSNANRAADAPAFATVADGSQFALERALENLAASRHHLESPLVSEWRWGTRMAATGAQLAIAVARARGDTLLEQRARAIERRTTLSPTGLLALGEAAIADAADPAAPVAMELFDDEKLPFAIRAEILYATLAGSCRNTREVLFGFTPARERQLRELATRWQTHPSLGPVLGLMPPAARRLRERPISLLSAQQWPSSGALDFLLPEATAARAVLCQQPF